MLSVVFFLFYFIFMMMRGIDWGEQGEKRGAYSSSRLRTASRRSVIVLFLFYIIFGGVSNLGGLMKELMWFEERSCQQPVLG